MSERPTDEFEWDCPNCGVRVSSIIRDRPPGLPATVFGNDLRAAYNWRHPLTWLGFQVSYYRARWLHR